jgi:heat shock 70kDa protein 1/2/6/8
VAIPSRDGGFTTPSVVAFATDGTVLVGTAARRQAASNPLRTFHSVKRFIGRSYVEVAEDAERVAFGVMADEDGMAALECPTGTSAANEDDDNGGTFFPEEISAHILARLLEDAETHSGRPARRAVVSVPAYFNDVQREATAIAARIAGLESVKIVREPVAAALAYGLDARVDQTVLVFDLGGGTFDVSLLEVGGGVIEVLSTGGDPHLGGDDWDAAIAQWLVEKHLQPRGVNCSDPAIVAGLRAVAEAAKIKLSTEERVVVRMPIAGGIEATLTRQTFEGLTADLFRRARLPLDQACWQAGVDLGTAMKEWEDGMAREKRGRKGRKASRGGAEVAGVQIRPKRRLPVGEVLLVGGATRMPAVRRFVKNMTGIDPKEFAVDPDLVRDPSFLISVSLLSTFSAFFFASQSTCLHTSAPFLTSQSTCLHTSAPQSKSI